MNDLVYIPASTGHLRTAGGTLVVPVVALVGDMILHAVNSDAPEFIPASVLSSHVTEWAGKPVVNGHPTDANGRQLSASAPGIIASHAFGEIRNPRVENRKLLMDCHLDPTRAEQVGASALLARLRAGQTSEISVGCFVTTDNTPGTFAGKAYVRRWASIVPDHVAAVSRGACSCEQGCGFARAASIHLEDKMENYEPPDPYREGLARLRRDLPSTSWPEPAATPPPAPGDYTPPDPYREGLARLRRQEEK